MRYNSSTGVNLSLEWGCTTADCSNCPNVFTNISTSCFVRMPSLTFGGASASAAAPMQLTFYTPLTRRSPQSYGSGRFATIWKTDRTWEVLYELYLGGYGSGSAQCYSAEGLNTTTPPGFAQVRICTARTAQ